MDARLTAAVLIASKSFGGNLPGALSRPIPDLLSESETSTDRCFIAMSQAAPTGTFQLAFINMDGTPKARKSDPALQMSKDSGSPRSFSTMLVVAPITLEHLKFLCNCPGSYSLFMLLRRTVNMTFILGRGEQFEPDSIAEIL